MSRRSEKSIEGERLFHDGYKLVDIAKKLEVPEGTVRRWKSTQNWDGKKKQPERSGNKANANAKSNPNVRAKGKKEATINASKKTGGGAVPKPTQTAKIKNNSTPKGGAPLGNKNAVGNSGGAPPENKNAVTTGEYENILLSKIANETERRILEMPLDVLLLQETQIKKGLIREKRMMERIGAAENAHGGMLIDSIIKDKGVKTTKRSRLSEDGEIMPSGRDIAEEHDNTQTIAESSSKRVERIEDSLTRVMAGTQRGIQHLYKMQSEIAGKEAAADGITLAWIEGVLNGQI